MDKKYSRNLGQGKGIELVTPPLAVENGPVENMTKRTKYNYIRHAVQDANDGDVIVVAPGVYKETVSFNGKALIIGSNDPGDPAVVAATVIEGDTEGVTFTNGEDANSVLAGFTIRGATRGIYCQGASPTIVNCRIVDNVEAGIKLWDGSNPVIANCIIAGNGGDGIEMWASAKTGRVVTYNYATIMHCTIVGNRGNGIRGGKPVVVSTIVRSNGVSRQRLRSAPMPPPSPTATCRADSPAPAISMRTPALSCRATGPIPIDPSSRAAPATRRPSGSAAITI